MMDNCRVQVLVGSTIGLISKVKFNMRDNKKNYWDLTEGKVKSITINSKGRRVKADHSAQGEKSLKTAFTNKEAQAIS